MTQVNVYEAKTQLSKLLESVEAGGSVTIARNGRPIADLVPHVDKPKGVVIGGMKGVFGNYDDADFDGVDPEIQRLVYGDEWQSLAPTPSSSDSSHST